MGSVKTETLKGVKWSAFNNLANRVVSFVLGIILARLLTPDDFGVVGMASIFFALAGIIVDSGLSTSLIRKKDVTKEDCSTIFYFNVVVSLVCFLILYVCSDSIALFLGNPILSDIVKVSALSMVIGAFGSVQLALMTKSVNFKTPALLSLPANVTGGAVGIVLAYKGFGPWAIVYQSITTVAFNTIGYWIFSKWRPSFLFSWKSFKELFGFSSNIMINAIFDKFYNEGTGMIIGKYYSPAQLGYYTRGQHTAQLPSTVLNNIVSQVTLPVLSKIQDDDERLMIVYRKYMRILSLVIFFGMILLVSLARPIVVILYTDKWLPAVIFLQIFCLRYMLFHIHSINWNLLMVKGRSDWALRKEIVNKTISFGLLFAAIPLGVEYICWAVFLASVLGIFVNTWVAGHLFNFGFRKQVSDFLPYLLMSIISCIPSVWFSTFNIHPIFILVLGILVSSILYICMLIATKDSGFRELVILTPLKKYYIR